MASLFARLCLPEFIAIPFINYGKSLKLSFSLIAELRQAEHIARIQKQRKPIN